MNGFIAGIVLGSIVILAGVILLIIYFVKKKTLKRLIKKIGTSAEITINSDIKIWAKQTRNKFIPATIFKYGVDKVFEVDSVLITDRALIVVEIKSIKGGIVGNATEPVWNKVLGSVKHNISNPIIQNDKHIEHIIRMTNDKIPTISLIIYSNRASYINISDIPPHVVVTKHADLFDTLDEINKSLTPVLNEDQVKQIYTNIKSYKATKKADMQLHKNITMKGHGR